jgi:hypothetical protein
VNSSSPPVIAHLDGLIGSPLSERLRELLPRAGVSLSEARTASVAQFTAFDALAAVAPGPAPVIALCNGRLESVHAAALRRSPPALLLAGREPGGLPSAWETRLLVAVLSGAPLLPATAQTFRLTRVKDIPVASQHAVDAVRASAGSRAAEDIAADVMHELTANALYDAPAHADGTPKYAHQRGPELEISPEDGCEVAIHVEDGRIYLLATDWFGRLTVAPIAAAVAGIDQRAKVNATGGGAGLGLRRMLEQSDLYAVRVRPGEVCQVLCVIDLANARRRATNPKSVFYFVERG